MLIDECRAIIICVGPICAGESGWVFIQWVCGLVAGCVSLCFIVHMGMAEYPQRKEKVMPSYEPIQTPPAEKPMVESKTNLVAVLSPVVVFLLTLGANAVGIPVPPGLLDAAVPALVLSVAQSVVTLIARNRKGGGGQTRGVFNIPG